MKVAESGVSFNRTLSPYHIQKQPRTGALQKYLYRVSLNFAKIFQSTFFHEIIVETATKKCSVKKGLPKNFAIFT